MGKVNRDVDRDLFYVEYADELHISRVWYLKDKHGEPAGGSIGTLCHRQNGFIKRPTTYDLVNLPICSFCQKIFDSGPFGGGK